MSALSLTLEGTSLGKINKKVANNLWSHDCGQLSKKYRDRVLKK